MWSIATVNTVAQNIAFLSHRSATPAPPADVVGITGFLVSILALLCWGYGRKSRPARLALAMCFAVMAFYGFVQGAWPLGIMMTVFSAGSFHQWRYAKTVFILQQPIASSRMQHRNYSFDPESRLNRMFGRN